MIKVAKHLNTNTLQQLRLAIPDMGRSKEVKTEFESKLKTDMRTILNDPTTHVPSSQWRINNMSKRHEINKDNYVGIKKNKKWTVYPAIKNPRAYVYRLCQRETETSDLKIIVMPATMPGDIRVDLQTYG